jgi:hypothetical protein
MKSPFLVMRQTKSHKILAYALVSGLNLRYSHSAKNLPDSQAFELFIQPMTIENKHLILNRFRGASHGISLPNGARNA